MSDGGAITNVVITASGGLMVGALSIYGSRIVTRAQARLHIANASKTHMDTVIGAAEQITKQAEMIAGLYNQNSRQQAMIDRINTLQRLHTEWDTAMLKVVDKLRSVVLNAGLTEDVPEIPEAPPLEIPQDRAATDNNGK